jgi:hypothetical protein
LLEIFASEFRDRPQEYYVCLDHVYPRLRDSWD